MSYILSNIDNFKCDYTESDEIKENLSLRDNLFSKEKDSDNETSDDEEYYNIPKSKTFSDVIIPTMTFTLHSIMKLFMLEIKEEYDIDIGELQERWMQHFKSFMRENDLDCSVTKEETEDKVIKICSARMLTGKFKGQLCTKKVSDKSVTKSFCNRHLKQESFKPCQYKMTKSRVGEICGKKVKNMGDFCRLHKKVGRKNIKNQNIMFTEEDIAVLLKDSDDDILNKDIES